MKQPSQHPEAGRRLRYAPIVITVLATLVLTVGSFFGCASQIAGPNKLGQFFFFSFFVCAAGLFGAVIWLIVAVIVNVTRDARQSRERGFF